MQTIVPESIETPANWPKPVILGSLAVLGVSLVVAILYPRARAAIAAAVVISPIPPLP